MSKTKTLLALVLTITLGLIPSAFASKQTERLKPGFKNPPTDYWPHTRWWWPGNPVSKEEITRELEQMREVGITGAEQITMQPVYQNVDIPYMSDEFLEMVRHTIQEAKRLGMKVSLNFGGPGWIIGGPWVPEEDRSKDMVPTSVNLVGPARFQGRLPTQLTRTSRSWELYEPRLSGKETLLAVVAGHVVQGKIDERTLTDLTAHLNGKELVWDIPDGDWKLMAFWLAPNGHANAVDHFNKGAMERYCSFLGGKFKEAAGVEFGTTLESFFCDSFELPNLASGIYWSTGLMDEFERVKGYELAKYLPAIWWEVGDISPKIRYDVNHFLHLTGMEAFFGTFLSWCERNGIQGRIQTYGFSTDNIEAAGVTHIPEMEITPGEKDSAPWFDTRIGPKKYVASGAHIYGRPVVSVEAYTFLHWERYRATLEEIKIATDGFLRSGATRFVNHGFSFLPERDLAPSRRMPWAPQVNPSNVWWKHYGLLSQYIARSAYLLRQGSFSPDIAVYSPLANQWTKDVLNARRWTRDFDWGELGFLLISNGYDFDLLNDDALQNIARFEDGRIKIREMEYRILLLPNVQAMPVETMEVVEEYVAGGGVVIALDRVPDFSTGLLDHVENDREVRTIVNGMFKEPNGRDGVGTVQLGAGQAHFIKRVLNRKIWWDQRSSALDPFLNTIRSHVSPDFGIDFAFEGLRKNEGLTFLHRKLDEADIYFVTNIQDRAVELPVTFRVTNRNVSEWNPFNGDIRRVLHYRSTPSGTVVPLRLSPYGSTFYVFEKASPVDHVEETEFDEILSLDTGVGEALAGRNGNFQSTVNVSGNLRKVSVEVSGIPAPLNISGTWRFQLKGRDCKAVERSLSLLASWTDDPETRHCSGTGRYDISFELANQYLSRDHRIILDLGKIGSIAEVTMNGQNAGTVWIRGQQLDVTNSLKPGTNQLTVLVTNTGINRVSGFPESPPVPQELLPRFGGDAGRPAPEIGFKPLPPSGLMGPVKLIVRKSVRLSAR